MCVWVCVCHVVCFVVHNHLQILLKVVCYQYWPSSGSYTFGEFKVELLEQEEQTGFLIRNLAISHMKVCTPQLVIFIACV